MPPMHVLIKPASGTCNLRCSYCFYYDEMQKREIENYGFMSLETLEMIVRKTLEYADGSCGFAFQGGEPTLMGIEFYRQLIEMQKRYNNKNLTILNSIQTNGYQADEEWAEFFAANHFLVGVSLDGIHHTHDAYRVGPDNQGTFFQALRAIRLFDEKKVEYNILTVVNARTASKVSKIYSFYQKNHFDYLQFIPCLDPMGEEAGLLPYSLTPELYGDFLVQLFDLWYLDFEKGRQPSIRLFDNYISILKGYRPEACDQRGYCCIQYVIEADGSVYPCDFYVTDQYRIGDFLEDTIEAMAGSCRSKEFISRSMEYDKECRDCAYGFLCRSGCRRSRTVGRDNKLGKNYFCTSYQKFFKAAMSRLKQIASIF